VAVWCLLKFRTVFEVHLEEAMFANAKDRAFVTGVVRAGKDAEMWTFFQAASTYILWPCERARRWGMICLCEKHVKMRQEQGIHHIPCFWNGRKLGESWTFLADEKGKLKTQARELKADQTENNEVVREWMRNMTLKMITGIDHRFGYLALVPWAFSRALTKEGAAEVVRQIHSRPLTDHDPFTQILWARIGRDTEAVAQGAAPSDNLKYEVKLLNYCSLDETCGEGYHRSTHHEHVRAPASTTIRLKQSTRAKETLARLEAFQNKHGERGQTIVRHHWRAWKNILQTSRKRRWDAVQMTPSQVLDRVYRQDARALDDFSLICQRVEQSRPVEPDAVNGQEELRDEYLVSVMQPNTHYSVSRKISVASSSGAAQTEMRTQHFHLLAVAHGNSRPRGLHTFSTADQIALTAHLAWQVVLEDRFSPDGEEIPSGLDSYTVFSECEPSWVRPEDIADKDSLYTRLFSWTPHASDTPSCILLDTPTRCKNLLALTDPRCPTISLAWSLKKAGWRPVVGMCTHNAIAKGPYDAFEAVKLKFYYQVLACITQCIGLTSSIPSREPQKFYQCLLAGLRVEPGRPSTEYHKMLVDWKRDNPEALVVVEPEEELDGDPLALEDQDDDVVDVVVAPRPKKVPRRRRLGELPGRGGGGDGAPKAPPPLPPPLGPGPSAPPPPPPPAPGTPVESPPGPGEEDEVDVIAPVPVEPEEPARRRRRREDLDEKWAPSIDGVLVRYEEQYHLPGEEKKLVNWQLRCPRCPKLANACMKVRTVVPAHTARFGAIEPLAFLHSWIPCEPPKPGQTHRRANPEDDAVARFVEEHRDELQEVVDRLVA